jgi:hypothetical protein
MNDKKKFLLRLDTELYDVLEKWASDDHRSVNAEMEFLLKEAVRKAGRSKPGDKTVSAPAPAGNPGKAEGC